MQLGFKVDGMLRRRGWKPGALSEWDIAGTVRELRYWRDQGFEVVEHTADLNSATGDYFRFTPDEWRKTREVVEEAGLRMHSVLGWRRMICREPWAPEKLADLQRIAEVSEILGLRIVDVMVAYVYPQGPIVGGAPRPPFRSLWDATLQDFEVSAARLKAYARQIAGFGASLSLEIHEDTLHDTAVSALRLLTLIDEPNVGVNPDTLDNAYYFPGEAVPDAATQAKMVAPYVNHWHVKQFTRALGPDGQWQVSAAYADEGSQPIQTIVQHLLRAGYRGAAILECGRGADEAYNMKRFRDYLHWLIDDYGSSVLL